MENFFGQNPLSTILRLRNEKVSITTNLEGEGGGGKALMAGAL